MPRMLNRRNKAGKSQKAFSFASNLKPAKSNEKSLFLLYPMMAKIMTNTLKENTTDVVDKGVAYPRAKYTELIKRPKNIRKATLRPTDNTNLSVSPGLFNFSV
jgi:hypothetical protein